jgi:hypothetical protein
MPCVGFELTIPALERAKTIHALDRAATVTSSHLYINLTFYVMYLFLMRLAVRDRLIKVDFYFVLIMGYN